MGRKRRLYELRLSAWQRRLLVGAIVALTGQFFLSAWAEGFRVSAAAILYPVLLVILMRDSHLPDTGVVTGLFVLLLRMGLDLLGNTNLSDALLLQYPGSVFYIVYDCLLCLLLQDRRSASPGRLWMVFGLCDFCSNLLNLILSGRAALELHGGILLSLAGLALVRSFTASAMIWLMACYHQFLLRQEHELRYQRLVLMTAELKTELYFLRKSAEETEQVMANAYHLYERAGELGLSEEDRTLALSIARDVHEMKKDSLRIIRGLESEVAETYDLKAVSLSDLLGIVENSTRHLLGEQRADIRLEVRCLDNFLIKDHYQLIAALKNLVTNAIEAIQSGTGRGTVQVTAQVKEDCLYLEVQDDGPGITPRARENLFQVGYSTKFDPETGNIGRGVGLPSVQHIVQELGGEIRVDAVPGQGACFLLKLPLKAVKKEASG